MRYLIIVSVIALATASMLVGCDENNRIAEPTGTPGGEAPEVTLGGIHTEVLAEIHAETDPVKNKSLSRAAKDQLVVDAVHRVCDRHGVERMPRDQIVAHVELGRQMAKQDPVQLVADVLTSEEMAWWDRYSGEARVGNARRVYEDHVRRYGAPRPGGTLARILEVTLSSAEFWNDRRGDDTPTYQNPYVPDHAGKGWRNVIRFVVTVVVDGVVGGAAGVGGTVVGGPVGGLVGAGIGGGLASHGADDIIFG